MATSFSGQLSKPRMLVVDDEPDNLDLLYRTFRREFQVLRAASGQEALEILSREGEVAVIISDQRMPEMKGTEFLSKTLPEFPDTMRIILTGFTDVEDLVEAINAGQVYRFITKPWEPDELKRVVYRAAETYTLLKQRTQQLSQVQLETQLIDTITAATQTVESAAGLLPVVAQAFVESTDSDGCILQLVDGSPSTSAQAAVGAEPRLPAFKTAMERAITSQTPRLVTAEGEGAQPVTDVLGVAQPVMYQQRLLAILWVQWSSPRPLASVQPLLSRGSHYLAIALKSLSP